MANATFPSDFLDQLDTFIFDCDGVLWKGGTMIEGALDLVHLLLENKKNVFFVTNNSTASRKLYAKKFEKKGFRGVDKENILCSSYAAARYLSMNGFTGKVFVIGEQGIYEELEEHNISYVGDERQLLTVGMEPPARGAISPIAVEIEPEEGVKAVIVGFDRYINYLKLSYAFRYLTDDPECLFIATNRDRTYPSATGLMPGSGTIVRAVEEAVGRAPTVTGKPSPILMDVVQSKVENMDVSRTLMVGDRLDTDILFGNNAGVKTLLVLSGVSSQATVDESTTKPTYILNSIADMLPK